VPDTRPPLFPLEGRSLTFREYSRAVLNCLDRRIEAVDRGESWPDQTEDELSAELADEVAAIEGRRMIERLAACEPWEEIRRSVVGDRETHA
jgi:hypothetical protein